MGSIFDPEQMTARKGQRKEFRLRGQRQSKRRQSNDSPAEQQLRTLRRGRPPRHPLYDLLHNVAATRESVVVMLTAFGAS